MAGEHSLLPVLDTPFFHTASPRPESGEDWEAPRLPLSTEAYDIQQKTSINGTRPLPRKHGFPAQTVGIP